MRVEWTCGHFVGPAHWKFSGDWIKEPDECGHVFVTEEDDEEWAEGIVSATCPKCGADLSQKWDEPEAV